MDIVVLCSCSEIAEILRNLKFRVERKNEFYSARRADGIGSHHALFREEGGICYIDLHYDFPLHFLFLGVDYKRRPMELYMRELRHLLGEHRIEGGLSWFDRRNKAMLRGMR